MSEKFKGILPHFVAIIAFIALSAIYFYPQLNGLKLRPGDITHHIGMSKEISDYREKFNSEPLWTNSMFSGMPAYQISTRNTNYVASLESNIIFRTLNSPIGFMVLGMIGFYILLICFSLNPWLSIIGAVGFGLASLNILYIEGGHLTKVHAIALVPPLIGSMLLAYRKNMLRGGILLAFFLCLELNANHLQMTYYALFLIAALVIVELVNHIQNKQILKFAKVSGILAIAVGLGVLPTVTNLFTTYEYSKYTTRGKSELTITPQTGNFSTTNSEALSSNYIKEYNLGNGEVLSMIIPNIKGGSAEPIGNRKGALKGIDSQYSQMISQQSSYWGEQSFSGGAFYFGITLFVLFVLGMVFVKDPIKWAFLAITLLSALLSLKYGFVIDWFIDHFPVFNKFRDTKMILYLIQIAFPFVAVLFINHLTENKIELKKLLITLGIINGVLLLMYMLPTAWFDFFSFSETDYFNKMQQQYAADPNYSQQISTYIGELQNARINIFKADLLRSLIFSILTGALILVWVKNFIKKELFIVILALLVIVDIWAVDKRYLNNEKRDSQYQNWVKSNEMANPIQYTKADNTILTNEMAANPELGKKINEAVNNYSAKGYTKDVDTDFEKIKVAFRELNFNTDYRVLILNNPFANSSVSYFHKSIGGYHGAKLKKYQELIDFYLNPEYQGLIHVIQDSTLTSEKLDNALSTQIPVLNMLNTKYIIVNPNSEPILNKFANGDCWVVKQAEVVDSANQEILALDKFDLKTVAVVNKKDFPAGFEFKPDSLASITLTNYLPNKMTYVSKAQSPQMVVFSEIYYPAGWNVYINGTKAAYFKADYTLRAMVIPQGENTIEFRFDPQSYRTGENISKASSILLVLLVLGWAGFEIFTYFKARK